MLCCTLILHLHLFHEVSSDGVCRLVTQSLYIGRCVIPCQGGQIYASHCSQKPCSLSQIDSVIHTHKINEQVMPENTPSSTGSAD